MSLNPDMASASDWMCRKENLLQLIRSTTHIWIVTRQTLMIMEILCSFLFLVLQGNKTSGGIAKYHLFSQATLL